MRSYIVVLLLVIGGALVARAAEKPKLHPPTLAEAQAVQQQGRYLATITLKNDQQITVVLEGAYMPFTVANFVNLAQAKFYDGLTFHSLVDDFIVQGGDPKANGYGGPGYTIKLEVNLFLSHKPGAISMARHTDLNSAGSQFFFTLPTISKEKTGFLDGRYAVFGWVKSGLEIVGKLYQGEKMKSVTVAPYDGKEDCPILAEDMKDTKTK